MIRIYAIFTSFYQTLRFFCKIKALKLEIFFNLTYFVNLKQMKLLKIVLEVLNDEFSEVTPLFPDSNLESFEDRQFFVKFSSLKPDDEKFVIVIVIILQ